MKATGMGGFLAPYVLEYTYRHSTGPVLGGFLSGLRERRIQGARTASGKVVVPPVEYDPDTGEPTVGLVPVGDRGTVTTWAWMEEPRPRQPLHRPFAWALIKLDGADSAMLHAVDAGAIDRMRTGMRVRARWSEAPVGAITDITTRWGTRFPQTPPEAAP
jgi:uncharacterized OB-fold protein